MFGSTNLSVETPIIQPFTENCNESVMAGRGGAGRACVVFAASCSIHRLGPEAPADPANGASVGSNTVSSPTPSPWGRVLRRGRPRKYFAVTKEGVMRLRESRGTLISMWEGLETLLDA